MNRSISVEKNVLSKGKNEINKTHIIEPEMMISTLGGLQVLVFRLKV